jgi:hypothetical protein
MKVRAPLYLIAVFSLTSCADVMLGVDHVLATQPYVDPTRTCALGASFGGYMACSACFPSL